VSVKYVKIRFNVDKESDRKAYDQIRNSGLSQSKFIIAAVNAYGGYLSIEQEKKQFCRQVNDAIHAAMREIFGGGTVTVPKPTVIEKTSEESGKIADDFLDSFN
jgi:hypothetical protein